MFVFSKIAVIAFFAICAITLIQGNFITDAVDSGIYNIIDVYLKEKFKDNPRKAECMSDDFRRNNVASKFYTTDIAFNQEKLQRELQPYMDAVNLSMCGPV